MHNGHIKIMIADDRVMQRDAIKRLLAREGKFQVVGEASNAIEILDQLPKVNPDVMLLDLNMRRESGMEVLRSLNGAVCDLRVLLLTSSISSRELLEAIRLGICGLVKKNAASDVLFKGIHAVMAGQYWIDRESVARLVRAFTRATLQESTTKASTSFGLTEREIQVLAAIVDGYTNRDMAKRFSISEQTVKHHLTRIYGKAGVSNRLELALFAMNNNLVPEG